VGGAQTRLRLQIQQSEILDRAPEIELCTHRVRPGFAPAMARAFLLHSRSRGTGIACSASTCAERPIAVLELVTTVLELAAEPMRACEIHAVASGLIGESIRWSSVKGHLSAHTIGRSCEETRGLGVAFCALCCTREAAFALPGASRSCPRSQ
jgi:hypothetical protein